MKIALAHDWLDTTLGGSERVLIELAHLYARAPIYTLIFDPQRYQGLIDPHRVRTSRLQQLPKLLRRRHKYLLPFIPGALEQMDFSDYEVVLSSSNGLVKGIKTGPATIHICYAHTPSRFVWEDKASYLDAQASFIQKPVAKWLAHHFKKWDIKSAQRVNVWLANSRYTAQRLKAYYHAEAQVIYPPVEISKLESHFSDRKADYYVIVSTLAAYKQLDIAISAFNDNGLTLKIIGSGPEKERLTKIAKSNIKFLGWLDEDQKIEVVAKAKAFVFPAVEDFGIAPVEAMAVGTPVIALGRGGLLETVKDGVSGVFFNKPTPDSVNQAISKFAKIEFDHTKIAACVSIFNKERFDKEIKEAVANAQP